MKKLILLLALIPTLLLAQKPQDLQHDRSGYVDDFAGIYTPEQKAQLSGIIRSFFDTVQIALVTVKSLEGNNIEDVSVELFNKWGVGSKSNNGLLILIAPTEHKAWASTGKAIQGDLTDLQCASLQREVMVPEFKKGDYFTGTKNLLNVYISKLSPSAKKYREDQEAAAKLQHDKDVQKDIEVFVQCMIAIALIFVLMLLARYRIRRKQQKKEEENRITDECNSLFREIDSLNVKLKMCSDFAEFYVLNHELERIYKMGVITPSIDEKKNYIKLAKEYLSENKDKINALLAKKNLVNSAKETLDKTFTKKYFSDIKINVDQIKDNLSNLIFYRDDYSKQLQSVYDLIDDLKNKRDALSLAVDKKDFSNVKKLLDSLNDAKKVFEDEANKLMHIILLDYSRKSEAENGRKYILGKIETMNSFASRKGISQQAIDETNNAINSAKGKLSGWDTLSIIEKYALYQLLLSELKKFGSRAENEANEIDRKAREEKERLERIEADKRRKKREQEEAEDRRRRESYSSSYSSYSSSYDYGSSSSSSSSYDSGSSSFSSGSDFGGGSSDGGGGGSSW